MRTVVRLFYTMPNEFRAFWQWLTTPELDAGKVTLVTVLSVAILCATTFFGYFRLFTPQIAEAVSTSTVVTTVTVLNTPPVWVVQAHETVPSATTTPTNAGNIVYWQATANDSGSDPFYLLLCKTNGTPFASSTTTPSCAGGATNQWNVSAVSTTTGNTVVWTSTTTLDKFLVGVGPFDNESNAWYAWVCDNNASGAACSSSYTQGDPGFPNGNSPFVVNHAPLFFSLSNSGNVNPGSPESWTVVATDTDTIRGGDALHIVACKSSGLVNTIYCDSNGTWATSTAALATSTNVTISTSTTIAIPAQDKSYNAYVYLYDNNSLVAGVGTTSLEGSNSSFNVNNITPTINTAFTSVGATSTDIILDRAHATTTRTYYVEFIVTDNNSCQNASSGNEISSATSSIYWSNISGGAAACTQSSQYNTNQCYLTANNDADIGWSCQQDTSGAVTGDGCSGPTDSTVGWYCTMHFWSNATSTDADATNWRASAQVVDDNYATSSRADSTNGTELDQFLAFNVATTSIAYGGMQPGNSTSPFVQTSPLASWGNVGIDENLYGDHMCTNWTAVDSCYTGSTSSIPYFFQQFATSSLNYNATTSANYLTYGTRALQASTSPFQLHINVQKTTATTTPKTKDTYWGIQVPSMITLSGAYTGQDSIIAVTSSSTAW